VNQLVLGRAAHQRKAGAVEAAQPGQVAILFC